MMFISFHKKASTPGTFIYEDYLYKDLVVFIVRSQFCTDTLGQTDG